MSGTEFSRRLRAVQDRLTRLGVDRGDSPEAVAALSVAVEELSIAGAELRQQNDELVAVRSALEEERRRYHDLFEHAPDAYLVTDPQGLICEANQKAAALLHVPKTSLIGEPLALFVAEEARPVFRSELTRLTVGAGPGRYEFRMHPQDEPAFDAEVSAVPVVDDGGRSVGLRWTLRDVTEPRRIEDRLRLLTLELERLVRERTTQLDEEAHARESVLIRAHAASEALGPRSLELIHGLDAIIWTADAGSGRFTFVSRGAEPILGHPVAAWLDDPRFWAEHLHPDDRGWMVERRSAQLRDGRGSESEYRLLAADGRAVWFREAVQVVAGPSGRPIELRGLLVNISRRKKVERQLYAHRGELSRRLDDLAHLHELSGRLAATLELQPILEEILTGAMSVQGALKGVVRLYRPDRGELVVAAATGLPEACLSFIARVPTGVGACGIAIDTGQPTVIADVSAEGVDDLDREAARLGGYRAALSIPLRDRAGALLGTIATYFDEPHHPPPRQVHLVALFAAQAADFIANASRYRESREAIRDREALLVDFAQELRQSLQAIAAVARDEVRAAVAEQVARLDRRIGDLLDALEDDGGTPSPRAEPAGSSPEGPTPGPIRRGGRPRSRSV